MRRLIAMMREYIREGLLASGYLAIASLVCCLASDTWIFGFVAGVFVGVLTLNTVIYLEKRRKLLRLQQDEETR